MLFPTQVRRTSCWYFLTS